MHALSAQAAFLCVTSAMLLQSAWLRRQVVWQRSAGTVQGLAFAAMWLHLLWRTPLRGLTIVLILAWRVLVAYRLWRPLPAVATQSRDNGPVFPLQDTAP